MPRDDPEFDEPGLDRRVLARLREVLQDHGEQVIPELLAVFADEGAKRVASMRATLDEGDFAGLKLAAHTLRGSAELIGARRLANLCGRVETDARELRTVEALGHVEEVSTEFEQVARLLRGTEEAPK